MMGECDLRQTIPLKWECHWSLKPSKSMFQWRIPFFPSFLFFSSGRSFLVNCEQGGGYWGKTGVWQEEDLCWAETEW